MQIVIEQAGAEIGYLLLGNEQNMVTEVEAKVNSQAENSMFLDPYLMAKFHKLFRNQC